MSTACGVCLTGLTIHDDCTHLALRWAVEGRYDIEYVATVVRRLAPNCYLCADAPSEHAEHVIAHTRAGTDLWTNIGGACARCNTSKGNRDHILSDEQQSRLDVHQRAFRDAFDRVKPALIIDALATRSKRKAFPTSDPYADQDHTLLDMALLFDCSGASIEQMTEWMISAIDLMQHRGWLASEASWPVGEAVADHVEWALDSDSDLLKYIPMAARRRS